MISVLLTLAACVMAASMVLREFKESRSASVVTEKPQFFADWNGLSTIGVRNGPVDAPVTIVEFSDLECPFCRRFHETANRATGRYGNQVSRLFIHYPLPSHRFARPAARAAECAAGEDRFHAFVHAVFESQDSLGLKSWVAYAKDAGVIDTSAFLRCTMDTVSIPRIEQGLRAGKTYDIKGTPTVLVNGWRFASPPTESELIQVVDSILLHAAIPGR